MCPVKIISLISTILKLLNAAHVSTKHAWGVGIKSLAVRIYKLLWPTFKTSSITGKLDKPPLSTSQHPTKNTNGDGQPHTPLFS